MNFNTVIYIIKNNDNNTLIVSYDYGIAKFVEFVLCSNMCNSLKLKISYEKNKAKTSPSHQPALEESNRRHAYIYTVMFIHRRRRSGTGTANGATQIGM